MQTEILISPLQISVIGSSGSEFIWASLFRRSLRKYFKEKKLKFVVGYDEEKPTKDTVSFYKKPLLLLDISINSFYKFSFLYNIYNCLEVFNKPKILWHFLPFSVGSTFNLGIIFKLCGFGVIGPIQPTLPVQDANPFNKNKTRNLPTLIMEIFSWLFFYLSKLTLRKADAIFVCNNNQKKDLIRLGVIENKIKIIGFGVDLLSKEKEIHKYDKVIFVCVGWFTSRKNQIEIIKAINRMPESITKKIEINFLGGGPLLNEVMSKCNSRTKNVVKFLGIKPRKECLSIIQKSDAMISTSRVEGYSQSALEAVGAGLALISTPVGGFKEIIEEAKNGIIVNYDAESVEKAIIDLTLNRNLLDIYKKKSLSYAALNTWDKQLEKMLYFINKT